jgi:AraC-like DNA-binding protein
MVEALTSAVVEAASVEEYVELTRDIWNLEFIQLTTGRFGYRNRLIATPRVTVYRECCNKPLHIRGEINRGFVGFMLPAETSLPCRLWGRDSVRAMSVAYMTPEGELDAVTGAAYDNIVLVFAVDLLDETARRYGHHSEVSVMGRDCIEYGRVMGFDVSVLELCAATTTARRTLERAFREHLGISPTRYLRLCRYRRALSALASTGARESSVSDVAIGAGFSELGRFAVEYRRLFGEKPSETLRRPPVDVPLIPGPVTAATR